MSNSDFPAKEIDDDFALHVCRNPYGWGDETMRKCRLYVCEMMERYKEAAINYREFAEENGLDTMIWG